jgi:hypothetical protein
MLRRMKNEYAKENEKMKSLRKMKIEHAEENEK